MTTPILPPELLALIVDFVAADHDEDDDGQQWLIRRSGSGRRRWKPLRALTQVNRFLRHRAMAAMWRDIRLSPSVAETDDNLDRLIEELMLEGDVATARNFVRTVDVHIPKNQLEESMLLRDVYFGTDHGSGQKQDQYRHDEMIHTNTGNDRSIPIMANMARRLAYAFSRCNNLQTIRWSGWIVIDAVILYQLSLCQQLTELSIDISHVEVECVYYVYGDWNDFKPPPMDYSRGFPKLETIELEWTTQWLRPWNNLSTQEVGFMEKARESFIDRLLTYGIPKQLKLGDASFL
ncbi:unnamed protein product [Sympodiomycopsis kandeliae]